MKYKWLNKKNNNKLIIFFNGWGMDENIVKHLEPEDFDVLVFYDYNTLITDFDFNTLTSYKNKILIAWSMGVMIASLFDKINFTHKIAINGTLKPIDIEFGIHPKIYDLTIKGFDKKGKKRFFTSMFNNNENQASQVMNLINERSIEEQKNELIALKSYQANLSFKYDLVHISDDDKIIPTKSQVAFWNTEPDINSGHCPFFKFKKWSEIL